MVILRCVLLLCLVSQAWAQDSGGEDLQAQLQELDSGVAADPRPLQLILAVVEVVLDLHLHHTGFEATGRRHRTAREPG